MRTDPATRVFGDVRINVVVSVVVFLGAVIYLWRVRGPREVFGRALDRPGRTTAPVRPRGGGYARRPGTTTDEAAARSAGRTRTTLDREAAQPHVATGLQASGVDASPTEPSRSEDDAGGPPSGAKN